MTSKPYAASTSGDFLVIAETPMRQEYLLFLFPIKSQSSDKKVREDMGTHYSL